MCGHREIGGAVRFDGHRAQHRPGVLLARQSNRRAVGNVGRLGKDLDQPQSLDAAARNFPQPLIDVGQHHLAGRRSVPRQGRRQNRRRRPGHQRTRVRAADLRIAVKQLAVAKRVQHVDSQGVAPVGPGLPNQGLRAVGNQKVLLRQWPRGRVVLPDVPAFGLRKGDLGRNPRDRLLAVVVDRRIDQSDRAAGDGVMRRGRKHKLAAAGNRLDLERTVGAGRRVAPPRHRVGAVGPGGPKILVRNCVPVDVVPAAVDDVAGVGDGRKPLVGVVK